jgi:hypothetical protein
VLLLNPKTVEELRHNQSDPLLTWRKHEAMNNAEDGYWCCIINAGHCNDKGRDSLCHTIALLSQSEETWHDNCRRHSSYDRPETLHLRYSDICWGNMALSKMSRLTVLSVLPFKYSVMVPLNKFATQSLISKKLKST